MKSVDSPREGGRERLLVAAIALFAERGVESVSLRTINRAAGHRNNSALHYHFGSKLGLIEAMDHYIQAHFDALREHALARLEGRAEGAVPSLYEVIEVFVRTYADMIEEYSWGGDAVRTLARMEFDGDERITAVLSDASASARTRVLALLRPLCQQLPEDEFLRRFDYFASSVLHGFADRRRVPRADHGAPEPLSSAELVKFYCRMGMLVLSSAGSRPD